MNEIFKNPVMPSGENKGHSDHKLIKADLEEIDKELR